MKTTFIAFILALSFLLIGCGIFENDQNKTGSNGIWYGYVSDGRTGLKLNFFGENNDNRDKDSANQIWIVVEGKIILADKCEDGDENSSNGLSRNGCFIIKGLPTNVELPVFAVMEGYHPFAGTILIDEIWDVNDSDNFIGKPAYYRNLRLFPKDVNYSYVITTEYNLAPLGNVNVNCIFRSQNEFDIMGEALPQNYVTPTNDFNPVISGVTNESGLLEIMGTSLTKGGLYECFGNSIIEGNVVSNTTGVTFTVGVDDPGILINLD